MPPGHQTKTHTKRMLTFRAEGRLVDDVDALRRLHGRRGMTRSAYVLMAVGRQVRLDKQLYGADREDHDDAT